MKTLVEVHETVDQFYDNHCVGLLLLHAAPGGTFETWSEQTVKLRELDREFQEAISLLAQGFQFLKAEIICGPDGTPDRIKITRRL